MEKDELIFKKRLVADLMKAGSRNLQLNHEREMKLREWIVPYLIGEFEVGGTPLTITEMRKFIDEWKHEDLTVGDYDHYYVADISNGGITVLEKQSTQIVLWILAGVILWFFLK